MRCVVDSNLLRNSQLQAYLAHSRANQVVLSDFTGMEAHSGNTLVTLRESFSILAQYPKQVIVLKSTYALVAQSGRVSGLQRRLIHDGVTAGFPEYCRHLMAETAPFARQSATKGQNAEAILSTIMANVQPMKEALPTLGDAYSDEARSAMREDRVPDAATIDVMMRNSIRVAALICADHPNIRRRPKDFNDQSFDAFLNTYVFRLALCGQLLALHWAAFGGLPDAKPNTVRNDLIDLQVATCATYFDGLLTNDQRLRRIHRYACGVLYVAGAFVPRWQSQPGR